MAAAGQLLGRADDNLVSETNKPTIGGKCASHLRLAAHSSGRGRWSRRSALAAAAAPNLALELAALVFVGYGSITFNSLAKTTLQLAAKPEMRGRVMALWALAWLGSTPIGGPIVGWAGQAVGARWSLVIGGLPTLVCGILALPALTRIDRRAAAAEPAAAGIHHEPSPTRPGDERPVPVR